VWDFITFGSITGGVEGNKFQGRLFFQTEKMGLRESILVSLNEVIFLPVPDAVKMISFFLKVSRYTIFDS